jgi:O-antigen ligase
MEYFFYLYTFLVPFENLQMRLPKGGTGLHYANVMMLLMFAVLFLRRIVRGRRMFVASVLDLPMVGYLIAFYLGLVVTLASFPEAPSPFSPNSEAVKRFLQFFNSFLFFWFASAMLDSRRNIRRMLLVMAGAALIIFRSFNSDLGGVYRWHYTDKMRSADGPFVWINANGVAAFFLYNCLFFFLYSFRARKRWEKVLFQVAAALYAYGVMWTFSRGSYLALVLAMLLISVVKYRLVAPVLALAVVTSDRWMPVAVEERLQMTVDAEGELDDSVQRRLNYWDLALAGFDESPIIGHGVGSFPLVNPTGQVMHNLYLETLFEMGIVGVLLLAFIWFSILRVSFVLWIRAPDPFDRQFGFALLVSTFALMVSNYFGDRFTHLGLIGHYWVLVGAAFRLYANHTGRAPLEDDEGEGEDDAEHGYEHEHEHEEDDPERLAS